MKLLGQRAPTLLDALLFDAWYRLEHAVFTKAIHHKQALGLPAHRERRLLQNLKAMPKLAYVAEIRLRGRRERPVCPWLPNMATYLAPHHVSMQVIATLTGATQLPSQPLVDAWVASGAAHDLLEGATLFDNYGRAVSRLIYSPRNQAMVPVDYAIHPFPAYLCRQRARTYRERALDESPGVAASLQIAADQLLEEASIQEHRAYCC
ncbi:hypothetical protein [Halomonas sp. THAF12]|uniref:hypothetical protein n=1 Tax=Halomonas sp. THAF12 TaxID=2587849 RepID=UPI001268C52C|nr:hypothetical protein [Halomonas sp. THAF12]